MPINYLFHDSLVDLIYRYVAFHDKGYDIWKCLQFGLVKMLQFGLWKCFGYQLAAMVLRPTYMSVSTRTTATNEVLDRSCCADNHARCYSDSTLILSERVAHSKSATATVGGGRGRRELAVIDGTLRRKGSPCAYTTATTTSNSTFA
uniref:Uncharacterized protein n=1 Tax=Oryza glumipatula TaxID=40148 RepID=A0A0E0BLZ5_9ORYZ